MAAALTMAAAILPTSAQELRTSYFMETSNYRHQMNPALLDSPYFGMFFSNINIGMTGNIGAKQFIFDTKGIDVPEEEIAAVLNDLKIERV